MKLIHALALCTLAFSASCSSSDETAPPPPPRYGAEGVTITKVALYQGLERVLAEQGAKVDSTTPIVAGRSGVIRVFYETAPESVGAVVTGQLAVAGKQPVEVQAALVASSSQADLASTVNIPVAGDLVGDSFSYRVSLLQDRPPAAENLAANHPSKGSESHLVEGPANKLRIVLVPFAYDYDGSGRVPDLSPEGVELYRQRLLQLYPVSDVEISVRDPEPWADAILPNGDGWATLGVKLFLIRSNETPGADYYYYGIFNPAETFGDYCGFSCMLGVTMVNDEPVDVGSEGMRLGLGVGFPAYGPDTAAHELGHAHGRYHVDCGPGLDPTSIDHAYPHDPTTIGVWGWDPVGGELIDPEAHSDIMSYCDDSWISDYNYAALLHRGKHVNLPRKHRSVATVRPRVDYELLALDGEGGVTWRRVAHVPRVSSSPNVVVAVTRADGNSQSLAGHYYRYDHLPGGWVLLPAGTEPRSPVLEAVVTRQ